MSNNMTAPGFRRVHLRSADGDHVTIYLPLDADGRLDQQAHRPWLCKTHWSGYLHLGELEIGPGQLNRFVWHGQDAPDSLTDFGTAPIRQGTVVQIYEGDDVACDVYAFTVMDVRKV